MSRYKADTNGTQLALQSILRTCLETVVQILWPAIVDSQLKLVQRISVIKMHHSYHVSKFAGIVSTFVSILANFGYHGDLKATANINMILAKLPPDLKEI